MKAFTKEFVHKLLKRLKEKGKLRRPGASGGSSSSRSHRPSTSTSTPGGESVTPGATPGRTDSSSVVLQTPEPGGEHDDLVNDIFGGDDEDGDGDDRMDMEGDSDMDDHNPPFPNRNGSSKPEANGTNGNRRSSLAGTASPATSTPSIHRNGAVVGNGNGNGHQSTSPQTQSETNGTTPTPHRSFGGIGVGAIKVDSFRPVKVPPTGPASMRAGSTPSRTPTSGGDPSPSGG